MSEKYFGNFIDQRDVANKFLDSGYHDEDWEVPIYFPTEDEILFASYADCSYKGDALVLFERDGKLFEVIGVHGSEYGLEGQWNPEETSWAALAMRERKTPYEHDQDAQRAFWALVDARVT
jgi:hypothetical protein